MDPVTFNFIFICVYLCLPTSLYVYHVCVDALGGQKMLSEPLKLVMVLRTGLQVLCRRK